jgi:hypothetical protein
MAAPYLPQPNADLDYLLAQVARALQLTPEQYVLAAQHYAAVADWLGARGSPLAPFRPWIYPQGSMALETTVRPRTREEYDLDLVCQMLPTGMTAIDVYNAVYDRLIAHGTYAAMVEKMKRCVRLNYAHDFHLDIIPAEPDYAHGKEAIRVPDRSLRDWTPSNPKGYVAWFTHRSRVTLRELRAKLDPLPHPTPVEDKPALSIAVQLLKRRRDMLCDADVAPRSIVLTTLAGEYYRGTDCVLTALGQVVAGIQQRIRDAHPGRITVCNPTNSGEKFCESFEGPGRYATFKWFIAQLEQDLQQIAATQGIAQLQRVLSDIFGEEPVTKAVLSYGELHKSQRDRGAEKFTGGGAGGLAIISGTNGATRTIPPNRYFGGEVGK